MAGRAKKNAQRERRKMEKRAAKERVRAEYQAKIEAGKNSKNRSERLRKLALRQRLVRNRKGPSLESTVPSGQLRHNVRYVPPSRYGIEFWPDLVAA